MSTRLVFLLSYCMMATGICWGQLPGYVHYNINNGLPGSTVYCITQDKDGFLWLATNGGLCRYDGSRFISYTVADGLPETEIIRVYADTQGRVWFAPFANAIGYYYKGKIHTQQNDSLLRKIVLKGIIKIIYEDAQGNIRLDGYASHEDHLQITPAGRIRHGHIPLLCDQVYPSYEGRSIFTFYNRISNVYIDELKNPDSLHIFFCTTQRQYTFPKKYTPGHVYMTPDSILYVNSNNGVYAYNLVSGKPQGEYLKGFTATCVFQDNEKNIWFGTEEGGLYKKTNPQIRTFSFRANTGYDKGIYCFQQLNGKVYAANETFWQVQKKEDSEQLSVTPWPVTQQQEFSTSKILYFSIQPNSHVRCVANNHIVDLDRKTGQVARRGPSRMASKDVWEYRKDRWLVATSGNVQVFNHATWQEEEVVWKERATTVAARNDTIWIGTLTGLHLLCPSDTLYLGEQHPALRKRIAKIHPAADGSVWVAMYGYGLVQWKNGKVLRHFTLSNGLSGNICTSLAVRKDTIWVGTDRGVSRLSWQKNYYQIEVFNAHSGLGSNYVHAVFLHKGDVYVGTSVGITVFPTHFSVAGYKPRLVFMGASSEDQPLSLASEYMFSYPQARTMRFEFAGISYNQGGAMQYAYRLAGLDSRWRMTTQPFVEYASLPGGEYVLEVVAYSGFDKASNRLSIPFEVVPPLWQRGWFQVLLGLLGVGVCSGVIYLRFRYLRQKTLSESQITSQLVELKHRALKAQMNPHFVFNSLNAIQQFIFTQDKERTNRYLSTLSRVIRQTLDLTSRSSIRVQEEIDYLTNYLILEQMRFDGEFTYRIDFDINSSCSQWYIPSMIVQPYVENSIRHGIRYKRDNGGMVCVGVQSSETTLCITVTDNGVGRQRAEQYKKGQPIEYQSRGTTLTQERIEILNRKYASRQKARVEIQDLYADTETCIGTQVTILFPMEIIHHLTHDQSHSY